jgi:hypothetical protein
MTTMIEGTWMAFGVAERMTATLHQMMQDADIKEGTLFADRLMGAGVDDPRGMQIGKGMDHLLPGMEPGSARPQSMHEKQVKEEVRCKFTEASSGRGRELSGTDVNILRREDGRKKMSIQLIA